MEAKNTDSTNAMDKVIAEYLSGKITYKEAINIMYPMYLADVEILQEKINKSRAETLNG
jgi:hypothetical protein